MYISVSLDAAPLEVSGVAPASASRHFLLISRERRNEREKERKREREKERERKRGKGG